MGFKIFISKHMHEIKAVIISAIITFSISYYITKHVTGKDFEKWQRKVGKEALENIKLEQALCQNALQTINDKANNIRSVNEQKGVKKYAGSNDVIVLEYFDNIRNQILLLMNVINKSKLTWENIFEEEAKKTREYDEKIISTYADIKKLKNEIRLQKEILDMMQNSNDYSRQEYKKESKEIRKIIKQLKTKINTLQNTLQKEVQLSKDLNFPSGLIIQNTLSSKAEIVVPYIFSGNMTDLGNISTYGNLIGESVHDENNKITINNKTIGEFLNDSENTTS